MEKTKIIIFLISLVLILQFTGFWLLGIAILAWKLAWTIVDTMQSLKFFFCFMSNAVPHLVVIYIYTHTRRKQNKKEILKVFYFFFYSYYILGKIYLYFRTLKKLHLDFMYFVFSQFITQTLGICQVGFFCLFVCLLNFLYKMPTSHSNSHMTRRCHG